MALIRANRRDPKIDRLAGLSLFRNCSDRELRHIAAVADEVSFDEGQVLMREGERAEECFVLIEGQVAITLAGATISTIGPGESVGELALVTARTRTATATAVTPGAAYVLGVREFDALLADVPSVSRAVLREVADRLVAADARL